MLAAPVEVGSIRHVLSATVKRDSNTQRLYVHEMDLEKALQALSTDASARKGELNSEQLGVTNTLLRGIYSVKPEGASKVTDQPDYERRVDNIVSGILDPGAGGKFKESTQTNKLNDFLDSVENAIENAELERPLEAEQPTLGGVEESKATIYDAIANYEKAQGFVSQSALFDDVSEVDEEPPRFSFAQSAGQDGFRAPEVRDADGDLLAPNGKKSKLTERQWHQVRSPKFKNWFGDWEKPARIDKLRKSKDVVISEDDYKGKYKLDYRSARQWIKDNLRNKALPIDDTGEAVVIERDSSQKVTSHDQDNQAHLKSIAAIPDMLKNAVFITQEKAEKNKKYESYRYYVTGIEIDNESYTAKLVVGVDSQGNKFYDHRLTQIEKNRLIDHIDQSASGFKRAEDLPLPPDASLDDTRLAEILQVGDVSKVTDPETGEPMVVAHSTDGDFNTFRKKQEHDAGWLGSGFYFFGDRSLDGQYGENVIEAFLNVKDLYYISDEEHDSLVDKDSAEYSADFTESLIGEGYDGVYFNGDLNQEFNVFEANQIKSATDNIGTFDPENDDIRYSLSPETKAAYDARVDALFGGAAANRVGAKVLDSSDLLGLLGHEGKPVYLKESKVLDGMKNHPRMTADVWKKIPQWLENPAAVFDSDTVDGRLVFIAPETLQGAEVRLVIEPSTNVDSSSLSAHLLLNAYDAPEARTPYMRWINGGLLRYADKKMFPQIAEQVGLRLPNTALQNKAGTRKILTEKNLRGYRREIDSTRFSANQSGFNQEVANMQKAFAPDPSDNYEITKNVRALADAMKQDEETANAIARETIEPELYQRYKDLGSNTLAEVGAMKDINQEQVLDLIEDGLSIDAAVNRADAVELALELGEDLSEQDVSDVADIAQHIAENDPSIDKRWTKSRKAKDVVKRSLEAFENRLSPRTISAYKASRRKGMNPEEVATVVRDFMSELKVMTDFQVFYGNADRSLDPTLALLLKKEEAKGKIGEGFYYKGKVVAVECIR